MLHLSKVLLVPCLLIGGCAPPSNSEVAMIAVVANPGKYEHQRISTYGFLNKKKGARLYVNREDALHDNLHHSIAINDLTTAEFKELDLCSNQYVRVTGTLRRKSNELGFAKEIRIKGKLVNTYSKFVCNQQYN